MKFVVDKNIPFAREAFGMFGDVVALATDTITREVIQDADVLIVRSEIKVNRSLLDGTSVKFVGTATSGLDHVDTEYLASKGIAFASAPGCNSNAVKEYVIAALSHLAVTNGFSLAGKSIGVVGVGNVGSKVVRAAEALGMRVLPNDPPLARQTGDKRFLPLDALMDCDIITLHVPLTKIGGDPTHHLFDSERFSKLKPGAIFINTSRGGVVETSALRQAITDQRVSFAVIDVWENEPAINLDLLRIVSLGTPHIAGHSVEGKVNAVRILREALCAHFGFDSEWNPESLLDTPEVTDIRVPEVLSRVEDILHYYVRQCYDISFDHTQLRRMLVLPAEQRGKYFAQLRTGYRTRREFSSVRIHLPPHSMPRSDRR